MYWAVSYFRRAAPALFSYVFSCAIFPVSERAKFSKAELPQKRLSSFPPYGRKMATRGNREGTAYRPRWQ